MFNLNKFVLKYDQKIIGSSDLESGESTNGSGIRQTSTIR